MFYEWRQCSFQVHWSDCRLPFLFLHVKMQLMFILYRLSLWSCVRKQTLGAARISAAARPHHPCLVVPTNLLTLSLCRWDFGEVRRMLYCLMAQERANSSTGPIRCCWFGSQLHPLLVDIKICLRKVSLQPLERLWTCLGWEICARSSSIPAVPACTASWVGIHVLKPSLTFFVLDLPTLPKPPEVCQLTYKPEQSQLMGFFVQTQATVLCEH